MKKHKIFKYMIIIAIGISLSACLNDDEISNTHVTGVYEGTLTTNVSNKSNTSSNSEFATAVVSEIDDKIEVYCYNEYFETTITLNIYENGETMMTCFSGIEFENVYGHSLNEANMGGNMQNSNNQWVQHLSLEHKESDKHYGSFNMIDNSFEYTFLIEGMEYHFQGEKKYRPEEIGF